MVPLIETARLRLRGMRVEDLHGQAAMLSDPDVVRHLGTKPQDREQVWRRIMAAQGGWMLLGYGYWTVESIDDGSYLGLIGFSDFKRALTPSIEGVPEMGWIFAPHAQGRGYASEAGEAALEWADGRLGEHSYAAIISPGNDASIRLARKLGFDEGAEADYSGETILVLRRPPASPASAAAATTPAA